ncbi:MAG: Xaa-Pro peptidase family protein [Candidatus Aureabacteria bacterium]|nr:Xaa-Pro peptidase family protein [Candidatus Auribacterota bacterium]
MPGTSPVARLRARMEGHTLRGLLVTRLADVRYLSGFSGSSAACLILPGRSLIFTDARYRLQSNAEVKGFGVRVAGGREFFPRIADECRRAGIHKLGFEPDVLTWAMHRGLGNALRGIASLIPAPPLVEKLRVVKRPEEIIVLSRLARVTDTVLWRWRGGVKEGVSEAELEGRLLAVAREEGFSEPAFRPIVAAGRHSAMPHHHAGRGKLAEGAPLLLDFGLCGGGYNSDLTRTFCWGKVTKRYRDLYTSVFEAQQAALDIIRAGIPASAVDAAARDALRAHGFERYFSHSLGHGIGLEVHEAPRLNRESGDILEAGMIITVEPGVYLEGWGGVRIEDMVLVEERGCRVLTASPKGLEDNRL